jgi:D-threo-aldose 1-dehydrogenase
MLTMKEVLVKKLGVKIPAAGFGCSALTGTDRGTAVRVLEAAFDAGVRHFDIARYYGFGQAEGILGNFVKRYRSQVTITTKFGITPPERSPILGLAIDIGRRTLRLFPALRPLMQRKSQALIKIERFSPEKARSSLETSLRELKTEYVDIYLLHDYAAYDEPVDEILAFLEDTAKAGKIRCFGIGTSFEDALRSVRQQPQLCDVIQFQNSVLTQTTERLPVSSTDRLVITHGSLGEGYRSVYSFLKMRRNVAKVWSFELGVDLLNQSVLSGLMLGYAAYANPNGLVLFSSRDPIRVKSNAKSLVETVMSSGQIVMFARLIKGASLTMATESAGAEGTQAT